MQTRTAAETLLNQYDIGMFYLYHILFHISSSWWRHKMETFSALLALCVGNSPITGQWPYKGQWRGALMFSLICAWMNGWVNHREVGDLRRHHAYYNVIVMFQYSIYWEKQTNRYAEETMKLVLFVLEMNDISRIFLYNAFLWRLLQMAFVCEDHNVYVTQRSKMAL